jgi:hypothetical protein
MNGNIAIDFRPGSEAVPHILRIIAHEGFDLCGLHLVPSCAERATLMLDCGWIEWERLKALETKLCAISDVIAVIHTAEPQAGAEASGAPAVAHAAA